MGFAVKWSSILQNKRRDFWPKVPFYREFHFILKNLVNFWKSSIFPLFLSLVTFSRVFCEFLFKIWKLQSFRFQNFTTNFQSSTKLWTLTLDSVAIGDATLGSWGKIRWARCKQIRSMSLRVECSAIYSFHAHDQRVAYLNPAVVCGWWISR